MLFTIQHTLIAITMLANIVISTYTLIQNPRSIVHKSFALLVYGISLWGTSIILLFETHNFSFSALVFASGAFWFSGLFLFCYCFPEDRVLPKKFWLWLLPALFIFLTAPFNIFISGLSHVDGVIEPQNTPFMFLFMLIFAFYIISSFFFVIRNYKRTTSSRHKNQFKYLFTGIGIIVVSIFIFNTLLPSLGNPHLNYIGLLVGSVFFAGIALEKGRLYTELERYNLELEELVDKRTKEIQDLQEHQRKALVEISHNLQTPLAVIQGELELLPDSAQVKKVNESINRVSSFIRQLMHLARLEQAGGVPKAELFNLSEFITDQVEYFAVMAKEKGVTIQSSVTPNISLSGNKKQIEELLTNLVVNAITYRDTKKKSAINISLSSDEGMITLVVTDNGIGIHKEDLPHICTSFYTSTQRDKKPGSTGLGLAICKEIVEKHKGTLTITSTLGEETQCTITLPLA